MAEKEKPTTSKTAEDEDAVDLIKLLTAKLNLDSFKKEEPVEKVIDDLSFDGLIEHWKTKGFKNIVTMVGAGISTSAGIPDFRSPGTGIYHNLQKYKLPYEMAIFDISFFRKNPKPFFTLAKELYPGNFTPTPAHYFVRLLHEKAILQRHYTQNIDTLERVAGIPVEKLVEAHGTFYTNHCIQCRKPYEKDWVKKQVFEDKIPKCTKCNNVVKPDIVFFGENLPDNFYKLPEKDFEACDLLIVMGTSLEVHPFAMLFHDAGPTTPRLIINRTNVIDSDDESNTRDVVYLGDCDDAVWAICKGMGWTQDLKDLMEREIEILKKGNPQILVPDVSISSVVEVEVKSTKLEDMNENKEEKK